MKQGGAKYIKTNSNNKARIKLAFILVIVAMFYLIIQLVNIQIINSDKYSKKASMQQSQTTKIIPKRGNIYDRNGNELATSIASYTVWVWPKTLKENYSDKEIKGFSYKISKILHKNKSDIYKKIASGEDGITKIADSVEKDKAQKLKELDIYGLQLDESTKRCYIIKNMASQVLGSVTDENEGRSGIELEYNKILSGTNGSITKTTDLNGNLLYCDYNNYKEPIDGFNLNLTIDSTIQYYTEKVLAKGIKTAKADRVTCISMNPKTGEILSMASNPTFDSNNATEPCGSLAKKTFNNMSDKKQAEYLYSMWRNSAINDVYEPGSVFKLITTSSALNEGVIHINDTFECPGSINVSGYSIHCSSGIVHGTQTLPIAVANSCNIAQIKIARKLGKDNFYKYLYKFGLTKPTGIDYPGEASPIIKSKKSLQSESDFVTMAYGQGIAVTPIQMLTAVSAIANDGIMMSPHLVKSYTDGNGNIEKTIEAHKVRRVISSSTASQMLDIMKTVVEKGVPTAQSKIYDIGGKTGTANKVSSSGGYSSNVIASFVCAAPIDDPQIVMIVIVDNPEGGAFGGTVAAPIAKEITINTLKYLGVKQNH